MKKEINVLSLGAGVQSSTMALMAAKGKFKPMPDYAVFADTQWEPVGVYEHLKWLETQLPYPVHHVTAGNIREDALNGVNSKGGKFLTIPVFNDQGLGRRQCTVEYKIDPIRKFIRSSLGLSKGQRVPKDVIVNQWLGISLDEITRMKEAREKWLINKFPLIDNHMTRTDCHVWFEKNYPGKTLVKSACIGCPFHNKKSWRDKKINDPVSWADAVDFDKKIRNVIPGQNVYLSNTLQPLDQIDLRNAADYGQVDMFDNECEGMCGI